MRKTSCPPCAVINNVVMTICLMIIGEFFVPERIRYETPSALLIGSTLCAVFATISEWTIETHVLKKALYIHCIVSIACFLCAGGITTILIPGFSIRTIPGLLFFSVSSFILFMPLTPNRKETNHEIQKDVYRNRKRANPHLRTDRGRLRNKTLHPEWRKNHKG